MKPNERCRKLNEFRHNLNSSLFDWFILSIVFSMFIYIYKYEESINFLKTEWFQNHWKISFYISLIYVTVIFLGQQIMTNYSAFDLKPSLAIWNLSLALFSTFGAFRILGEMITIIWEKGWYSSYCDNSYFKTNKIYLWYNFFVFSKVIELGDTLFLVLRKQKVQFIHWIHHLITLIYSFYISAYLPAIGRWMSSMNLMVHSAMYSYYTLRVLRIRIPKFVPLMITCSQVLQMFIGFVVNSLALYDKLFVGNCENGSLTAFWGTVMYSFYFFLFIKLFKNLYIKPKVNQN